MALKEIDSKYTPITGVDALAHWANTAPALSNDAVAFENLRAGDYAPYGAQKKQAFLENLGG